MHNKSLIKERENVSAFVTCERKEASSLLFFSSLKNAFNKRAHENTHAINI